MITRAIIFLPKNWKMFTYETKIKTNFDVKTKIKASFDVKNQN